MSDYRDLVVEHFAADEVVLREQLIEALAMAAGYRVLSQQAIHVLHDLTRQLERTRQAHARTLGEYRTLRERVMREAAREAA